MSIIALKAQKRIAHGSAMGLAGNVAIALKAQKRFCIQ